MKIESRAGMLKIYVGESDKVHGRPMFEEIVFEARKAGMAGATVFKGIMSFGASHSVHTMKIFAFRSRLMYSDCEFAPVCPLGRNSQ